jgi:hypothetical protein
MRSLSAYLQKPTLRMSFSTQRPLIRDKPRSDAEPAEGFAHGEGGKMPGSRPDDPDGQDAVPFLNGGDLLTGADGWKEANASQSEASVKADRETSDMTIGDLQKRTVEHVTKHHEEITLRTSVLQHGDPDRPDGRTLKGKQCEEGGDQKK